MRLPRWLRRRPRSVPRPLDLHDALVELGRCPCDAHRTAFLTLFRETDELLFLIAGSDVPVSGGQRHRVSEDRRLALQTVTADGGRFLLAFPDEASALRHDREAPYAGLDPYRAAAHVLEEPGLTGILVATADDAGTWASVSREHLRSLIGERRPGGEAPGDRS